MPDDIVMHGLRKTAACMLADGLCSTHEIASITGHKSLKEIERYTREANQRMLASAAISEAGTEREKNVEWQTRPRPEWQTEARVLIC